MRSTHNTVQAYGKGVAVTLVMAVGTAAIMAACSSVKPPAKEYSQDRLVDSIRVPAGNTVVLETTAVGVLNYECRSAAATGGSLGWVLASPKADLIDRTGKNVGTYAGPPPTWTHSDGSSVVGTQMAISPVVGAINIPIQLSKGASSANAGVLQNISYIQRINTKGGQDFSKPCGQADIGSKMTLPYQADYVFWKAG